MSTGCEASGGATGKVVYLVESESMASSTNYLGNGIAVAGIVADRRKSAKGMNGASFLGAGIAAVLVLGGGMGAMSALRAPSGLTGNTDETGLYIALADNGSADAEAGTRKTMGRHAATFDRDAFNQRMANAVLATEDPAIAVIPDDLSLAAVDKNARLERPSALADEKNVALLREALKSSEELRAARLALAQGLSEQQTEYHREVALLEAVQSGDDNLSSDTALAYASAPSARDALDASSDPFSDVLSGQDEGEAGVLLPDDDIPLPSFRPAPPSIADIAPAEPQKSQPRTAYAKPDKPQGKTLFSWFGGGKKDLPGPGSKIAIYDITNQVVIMPNGQRLEAHSGRGPTKDSPKYVNVHNRGSTPPNVYSLRMRESLFHGVEAIRMTPVGSAKMYGRNGLLTHSYLRRIPGDSAGCIAFADYKKFLNAFKRGEVTKIIVVPDISEISTYMAML